MADQTQPASSASPQPQSSTPATPPTNPGGTQQQAAINPLPISPYTGEAYDPQWGVPIQKGGPKPTIQQIMKGDIERKSGGQ